MANKINVTLQGDKELERFFRGVGNEVKKTRLIRAAQREVVKPFVKRIKRHIGIVLKDKTGNLRKSIGVTSGGVTNFGPVTYVQPRRFRPYSGHHVHLLERGTNPRRKKGGASTGRVRAYRFWARSEKVEMPRMQREMPERIWQMVERYKKRKYRLKLRK